MLDASSYTDGNPFGIYLYLAAFLVGIPMRKIKEPLYRKWFSTICGILLLIFNAREDFPHFAAFATLTVFLAYITKNELCHITMSLMTLGYTVFIRHVLSEEMVTTKIGLNFLMMQFSSKMIGFGLDLHHAEKKRKMRENGHPNGTSEEAEHRTFSFMDIFHYCFCHAGVVMGVFYTYRTYDDFINKPFSRIVNNEKIFWEKILKTSLFAAAGYVLNKYFFTVDHFLSEDFNNSGFLYIFVVGMIHGHIYKIWMQAMMYSSEGMSISSGFGCYPVKGENSPGFGPTKNYKQINTMTEEEAKLQEYDFKTVQNLNLKKVWCTPWIKVTISGWNMTFQSFFYSIYKSVAMSTGSSTYALIITMTISALWHGQHAAMLLAAFMISVFIHNTRDFYKIHSRLSGWKATVLKAIMYILRDVYSSFMCLVHVLYRVEDIHEYFKLIYYVPIIFQVLLLIGARMTLTRMQKAKVA